MVAGKQQYNLSCLSDNKDKEVDVLAGGRSNGRRLLGRKESSPRESDSSSMRGHSPASNYRFTTSPRSEPR